MLEKYQSCLTLEEIFIDDLSLARSEKTEEGNNDKIYFKKTNIVGNNFIAKLGCEGYVNGYFFSISVNGIFALVINRGALSEEEKKDLVTARPISILFPFLRSEVMSLTMKTNGKPVIIPIVNIDKLLSKEIN